MSTSGREAIEAAAAEGWRAVDGRLFKPDGTEAPVHFDSWGYPRFSYYFGFKSQRGHPVSRSVMVHRLVAFQKYGQECFDGWSVVRHLDGNKLNYRPENIVLGTQSQNMLDLPRSVRLRNGSMAARKLTPDQVKELLVDRAGGMKYSQLSEKYGLQKSTISYIVNRKSYNVEGVDR
jgi:hypothetical protein